MAQDTVMGALSKRLRTGRLTQRTGLYRGEVQDPQPAGGRKSLAAFKEETQTAQPVCWFPEDRDIPPDVLPGLQVKGSERTRRRPRVLGEGWLACRW